MTKHWTERIAEELYQEDKDEYTVGSGTSISGSIHIGNSCDVFIANAVSKELRKLGAKAKTLWIADDYDPLRKVPFPLPESYEKYLGQPYYEIPCPEGCCDNFVEHFQKPFTEALGEFDIEDLIIESGAKMYKGGEYTEATKIALENADRIREIFNQYREHPLKETWLPYNPICEECGRVNTTEAYDYDGTMVKYKCECGHEGEEDYTTGKGKLTWRVEWAARWKILGIVCEPFGKDHAASGGSYDVSKIISEEIFDYPAPFPVPYEWITLDGDAMSKSKGVFFSPEAWLKIGKPETLNYFIFRNKPLKPKDFSPKMGFLDLMDQYDRTERIAYDEEEASNPKEKEKLTKIYEVSQIKEKSPVMPFQASYRFLTVAYQIANGDAEKIYEILKKNHQLQSRLEDVEFSKLNDIDRADYLQRLEYVNNWLETYAPKFVKFQVMKKMPRIEITDEQKEFLSQLADVLENETFNSDVEFHDRMYEILEALGMKPQKAFQAIYKTIIGKKQGPRAASFVLSLDKDFVVKRFRLEE
ncbi:lysine--tRNA ligase [Methanosphaera cuniculi]|uniref:Lysine--tRNA ligase n=3 Tax=Methanosphaera TaxID=2316 RepID=A0A2A2HAT4_9EURY|nr:lysine--tRNA ligase [Methanosphaera cuniculi]PAV06519.1 lysine--tRNA ligase [Methanosphaera cuniculi]PWL09014.1 lysine--tRNA ligase [Methanosphaera cuniculi]